MLRQLDLSDLIESSREDVLSASVDIDPTKPEHQHDPPAYLIWLRHALKETVEGLPTLEALNERQAQVLVVDRDLEADLWQCQGCGYVTVAQTDTCPICGMGMRRTTLSQAPPVLARRNGARIRPVSREEATRQADGIGALLRYVLRLESLGVPG